jgi:spore germination protein KC
MIPQLMKILLVMFFLSFLTGCWSRKELNEIGIVTGMGIDTAKDGRYELTVQMVAPAEVASQKGVSTQVPVTTYKTTATSLMEAARKMTSISPRRLYFPHLRLLIIGKELADQGISNVLDFVSRDHEFRTDFYIVVAQTGKASQYLEINTPIEKIPSQQLFTKLETSEKVWAPTTAVKLNDLISALTSPGRDPVLTGITLVGHAKQGNSKENTNKINPDVRIGYSGISLFKKDKLVGWFNETESKGYNYIIDKVRQTAGNVRCPGGTKGEVTVETIRSKSKMKGKVQNGKPEVEIKIENEGNVGEVECKDLDLTKTTTISQIEKEAEQKIKHDINAAVSKAKKLKSDVFGFGEAIHREDPKYWKTMEKNWNEAFENITVNVNVDVKLRRTGTINNSFMKDMKQEE